MEPVKDNIILCQAGYPKDGCKRAVLTRPASRFEIRDSEGQVCFAGEIQYFGPDENSGDEVYRADFTGLCREGEFTLRAEVCGEDTAHEAADEACRNSMGQWISSRPFFIRRDVYAPVLHDTAKAFYYLRCGCGLPARYAGKFSHRPCHTGRAVLWEDNRQTAEAAGGWHDAGDYGRYVTAGVCALAHLLFAYQLFPAVFDAQRLDIPESGGPLPDLLAECRFELEWLLKMQRKDGAVYHKETTAGHAPFVMPEEDTAQLFLFPVSSMATADFAAVCALAARLYRKFDAEFSRQLQAAAQKTGIWLEEHPEFIGFENPPGCWTGSYGESTDADNRFWAWIELYLLTGEEEFHERARSALSEPFSLTALGYGAVGGFGALSYLLCSAPGKDEALAGRFREQFLAEAQRLSELSDCCGYGAAMAAQDYCWGSSMNLLKHGMIFAIAETVCGAERPQKGEKVCGAGREEPEGSVCSQCDCTKAPRMEADSYTFYAERQIQCLLGINALGFSYVSGTGENSLKNPHLRPAYADGVEECIPGMVSGGPNRHPVDETAAWLIAPGTPPMKCFADHVGCYSLNEITIYWNSPAVFLLAYLEKKYMYL